RWPVLGCAPAHRIPFGCCWPSTESTSSCLLRTCWSTGRRRPKPREDVFVTTAAATECDAAEPLACWCCGSAYHEADLVRLGSHPEVGVCLRCAHFLH